MSLSLDRLQTRQARKSTKSKTVRSAKPATKSSKARPWKGYQPLQRRIESSDFSFSAPWFEFKLEQNWWPDWLPSQFNGSLENLLGLTEHLAEEGQIRLSKIKTELRQPRTLKIFGWGLEVGARFRLHVPALKSKAKC